MSLCSSLKKNRIILIYRKLHNKSIQNQIIPLADTWFVFYQSFIKLLLSSYFRISFIRYVQLKKKELCFYVSLTLKRSGQSATLSIYRKRVIIILCFDFFWCTTLILRIQCMLKHFVESKLRFLVLSAFSERGAQIYIWNLLSKY